MTPSVGFFSFMTWPEHMPKPPRHMHWHCQMAAGPSGASTTQHTVKACFVEQCEFSQINKLTRLSFCRYFCVRCVPPCLSITNNYCPVAKCCKVPFFFKKKKKRHFSFFSFVKESRTVLRSWTYVYIMFSQPAFFITRLGWLYSLY